MKQAFIKLYVAVDIRMTMFLTDLACALLRFAWRDSGVSVQVKDDGEWYWWRNE